MKLLFALLFLAVSLAGQTLPDKPQPRYGTVRVTLIEDATNKRVRMTLPVPHRTADRAFWWLTAASAASTVVDVENTHYVLTHIKGVHEGNPFLGHNPSRTRLYGWTGAIFVATTYLSYRANREEDAERAFGVKPGWMHWWLIPLANIGSHAFGTVFTVANTGR